MANFKVVVTESALWSLQDAESFKSSLVGRDVAAKWADGLLLSTEEVLSEDPERYRYCAQLSDRAVAIRERFDPDSGFRCLYDLDMERREVYLLLFISERQDFEKMLNRYHVVRTVI